jgi:drug/metabolite transporter (DMT)-like permease
MTLSGEWYALFTALLWSASTLVFAGVTKRFSSVQANVVRLLLAEVYLVAWLIVVGPFPGLTLSQIALLVASGIVGLALGDSFLFKSYQEIGAKSSMLLMSTAPAIGALGAAWLLGERISWLSIAGMAVTLAGIAGVVVERSPGGSTTLSISPRGILFGVLAAAGQGIGLVLAKAAFRESPIDGFAAAAVRIAGGLGILFPVALAAKRLKGMIGGLRAQPELFRRLAAGAVLGPFLGIAASLAAVSGSSVGVSSTIMATVPVLLLPIEWALYGDRPQMKAVAGAIVAVSGVAMLFLA